MTSGMTSMTRLAIFVLAAVLAASPALAQQRGARGSEAAQVQTGPAGAIPPRPQPAVPTAARTGMTAGHAFALGVGMFGGAVLGSAMIQGGAFAAAVGAIAGLSAGHWYYSQHQNELD